MDTLFAVENINFKDILTYPDMALKKIKSRLLQRKAALGKAPY